MSGCSVGAQEVARKKTDRGRGLSKKENGRRGISEAAIRGPNEGPRNPPRDFWVASKGCGVSIGVRRSREVASWVAS